MSFTYSGDPSTSALDAARFTIGDTSEDTPLMQDEEIEYILDTAKSTPQLLALLFRHAATVYGARLVKRSLGPQSEDASARARYFSDLARKYEKMQSYAGVPPLPAYQFDKVFEKGMMSSGSTSSEETQ